MKYVKQILLIIVFSFIGEICHSYIPLPIPASIYGMVLVFMALACKVIKLDHVQEGGGFLVGILPVLFVAPVVGLIDCWPLLQEILPALVVIVIVTTVLTFWVAGVVTKCLSRKKENNHA